MFERESFADAVSSGGHGMATLMKHLNYLALELGETVGIPGEIMHGIASDTSYS
jgi:hypothetical protein